MPIAECCPGSAASLTGQPVLNPKSAACGPCCVASEMFERVKPKRASFNVLWAQYAGIGQGNQVIGAVIVDAHSRECWSRSARE